MKSLGKYKIVAIAGNFEVGNLETLNGMNPNLGISNRALQGYIHATEARTVWISQKKIYYIAFADHTQNE